MKSNIIYEIINKFSSCEKNDLHLIANTLDKTPLVPIGLGNHVSQDELFSREEFAEIASALYSIYGYVYVYYSETDFIRSLFSEKIDIKRSLIYNLSRDGTKEGKKSLIPCICDLFGLKYTGSNAFVLSLMRNKYAFSTILEKNNIPVPKSWLCHDLHCIDLIDADGLTVIIKNNNDAASVGLTQENIIKWNKEKFIGLVQKNNDLSKSLIVQEYIEGIECEVLVIKFLGNFYAQEPVQIIIDEGVILTSEISKYYKYQFCDLNLTVSEEIIDKIKSTAEIAARIINIKNYARFDFRINKNGEYFLFDIAGTPYTIKHSSIAYLFRNILKLEYEDIYKVITYISSFD